MFKVDVWYNINGLTDDQITKSVSYIFKNWTLVCDFLKQTTGMFDHCTIEKI